MQLEYTAPPTCAAFMRSAAFVRLIAGPVGSGKTSACIWEILRRGLEQRPGPDGIRHTRWAIVRQTLSQLKTTVLLDIMTWFRSIATYNTQLSRVILAVGDVRIEIYLIPLENPEDQKRLLSSQLTGAWMSEGIEIDIELISAIKGRLGRYPSAADGGATWTGLIIDTNFPTIGSPWQEMMDNPDPDTQIFRQPGGLQEDAENLNFLNQDADSLSLPLNHPDRIAKGREYYLRLANGRNKSWVDRYVHAVFGEDPGGSAVHRESFKLSFHVKDDVEPVTGQVILIGQDFGRNPCSLICQPDHKGRLLVLEEVLAEDIGLELHTTKYLRPRLFQDRYMGKMMCAVGDPSGVSKSSLSEETSFDCMQRLGVPAFPAQTNDIDMRIRAVDALLQKQVDGGPALVINRERCPTLVRALQGAYRYARTRDGVTKALPEKKHPWSDICDALQYVCLVYNAGLQIYMARRLTKTSLAGRRQPKRVSSQGWT